MVLVNSSIRAFFHCSKCLIRRSKCRGAQGLAGAHRSTSSKTKKYSKADDWIKPDGYHTDIHIYNTLTKRNDQLILPKGKNLSWYVCGPTVYDSAHVGHASCYMRFDIIRRILQNFFNINVTYMMGITDVDDKIIRRANELGQDCDYITKQYEHEFFEELAALNILQPSLLSRVTDNIPQIIRFIQQILEKGHAYVASDGSVFFDTQEYGEANYHRFIPPTTNPNANLGVKRHEHDFALWKAGKPGEPYWDSPWGGGRPGWHIECSVMASEMFGCSLDMHSGGQDLIFPHHENELAQSCSYHGIKQWANYWFHTGHLQTPLDEEKMSKSLKNVVPTSELLDKYTPNQFRMFCMMKPYQLPLIYSESNMAEAVIRDGQIQNFLAQCEGYVKGQIIGSTMSEAEITEKLVKTNDLMMDCFKDNFSTPRAIEHLFDCIFAISKVFIENESTESVCRCPGAVAAASIFVKNMCKRLGFQKAGLTSSEGSADVKLRNIIDETVKFRWKVRQFAMHADIPLPEPMTAKEKKRERNRIFRNLFKHCDELRTRMSHYKVFIQDRKNNSTWDFADRVHTEKSDKPNDQNSSQTKDNSNCKPSVVDKGISS